MPSPAETPTTSAAGSPRFRYSPELTQVKQAFAQEKEQLLLQHQEELRSARGEISAAGHKACAEKHVVDVKTVLAQMTMVNNSSYQHVCLASWIKAVHQGRFERSMENAAKYLQSTKMRHDIVMDKALIRWSGDHTAVLLGAVLNAWHDDIGSAAVHSELKQVREDFAEERQQLLQHQRQELRLARLETTEVRERLRQQEATAAGLRADLAKCEANYAVLQKQVARDAREEKHTPAEPSSLRRVASSTSLASAHITQRDGVTFFRVEVMPIDESGPWAVERRYQQFYDLQSSLAKVPGISMTTPFPRKHLSGCKGDRLEQRRHCLEDWLNAVLKQSQTVIPQLSPLVDDFLARAPGPA